MRRVRGSSERPVCFGSSGMSVKLQLNSKAIWTRASKTVLTLAVLPLHQASP